MWEKKIKAQSIVRKVVQLNVMLLLPNVTIEPSLWEKKNWTTKHDKSTVTCDFDTAQFEDGTIKCQKKKKKYNWMWQKYCHMWCWYYLM